MHTITLISYLLSILFLVFVIRAILRVIRDSRIQKKIISQDRELKAQRRKLKQRGLKEFYFNNGKVLIFAKNYKDANAQYQARKELCNTKPPRNA